MIFQAAVLQIDQHEIVHVGSGLVVIDIRDRVRELRIYRAWVPVTFETMRRELPSIA